MNATKDDVRSPLQPAAVSNITPLFHSSRKRRRGKRWYFTSRERERLAISGTDTYELYNTIRTMLRNNAKPDTLNRERKCFAPFGHDLVKLSQPP